jgi:hypothetical protein
MLNGNSEENQNKYFRRPGRTLQQFSISKRQQKAKLTDKAKDLKVKSQNPATQPHGWVPAG